MPSDNNLVPMSGDQAKAVHEVAGIARDGLAKLGALGGYFKEILGDIPKDLLGWAVGDRLQLRRLRNAAKIAEMAEQILIDRQVNERMQTGLSLGRALLDAASDEDRDVLQDVWARLIAAAMDPQRSNRVRSIFVTTLKAMDPIDALVFLQIRDTGSSKPNQRDFLAVKFGWRSDEVETSFSRLHELGVGYHGEGSSNCRLTPRGRELLFALTT